MGENHHQATTSTRFGIRSGGGEIVEVQGGHIVRSTGRKDRHSKVCTAKGPRDRRVRLSAHTAIQFYDVQDRLGYDRPSKAVDWLIKKAKAAIDELEELPAWKPTNSTISQQQDQQQHQHQHQTQILDENQNTTGIHCSAVDTIASGSRTATTMVGCDGGRVSDTNIHNLQHQMSENPNNNSSSSSSFLPPSLDSDSIADTIKSFFPMGASAETTQFQNYHPPPDLLSRTSSQSQDLRLSLQSFHDPILLHQHQHQAQTHHQNEHGHEHEHMLFSGATPFGFDGSSAGWSEHHHHPAEINRFQRMLAWNAGTGAETGSASSSGEFIFNSPPTTSTQQLLQPFFGQNQFFQQRGPLQSSNTPSVRAWIDPTIPTATATATATHPHLIPPTFHQSSISGIGFAPGGFSGFRVPARFQGEEEHDGISHKLSSASSNSRH